MMLAMTDLAELCGALFGDVVDVDALVSKMSPGPSDVHVPGLIGNGSNRGPRAKPPGVTYVRTGRRRQVSKRATLTPEEKAKRQEFERKVAQVSNAVGLTAGAAAIGSTARDPRLLEGGRVARTIHAAGTKIPSPIGDRMDKLKPGTRAKLAGGAFALQAGNVIGDVVTARVLGRKDDQVAKASLNGLVGGMLRRTGFQRGPGGLKPLANASDPILNPSATTQAYRTNRGDVTQARQAAQSMRAGKESRLAAGAPGAAGTASPKRAASARGGQRINPDQTVASSFQTSNGGGARAMGSTPKVQGLAQPAPSPGAMTPTVPSPAAGATPLADAAVGGQSAASVTAKPAWRTPANTPAIERGQQARQKTSAFLGTRNGGIAIGAGGTLAATGLYGASKKRQADPYAMYGKRAPDVYAAEVGVSKVDEDKRLAFGWASVVKKNGLPIIDRQGDYIDISDLEDAAYVFVEKQRVGGDMHKRATSKGFGDDSPHHVADMVESMVFTPEKIAKMGLPEDFPQGWWVGFRYFDDDVWSDVKEGRRLGFSVHGKGIRKPIDYDELMAGVH